MVAKRANTTYGGGNFKKEEVLEIEIKNKPGYILFESKKTTIKEAIEEANLQGANLQGVNLQGVNLQGANLFKTNLFKAYLRGADLRGADLDFSCLPLWCGSFQVKVDDRLVAQVFAHIARFDVSVCSPYVRYANRTVFKMFGGYLANLFCEFREDVKKIDVD